MSLAAKQIDMQTDAAEHWLPASIREISHAFKGMDDKRVFRCVGSILLLWSYMIAPQLDGAGGDIFRKAVETSGVWPIIIGLIGLSGGDVLKVLTSPSK